VTAQQLVLSLVLAVRVFSVALELRAEDFRRVVQISRQDCGCLGLNTPRSAENFYS
jgi:hypothetical protein